MSTQPNHQNEAACVSVALHEREPALNELLPQLIDLLESYHGIDDTRSQYVFGQKLDEMLEVLRSL